MNLTKKDIDTFQHKILDYYKKSGRKFPWRETHDPYKILVSEIMLQQTQTHRVVQKYEAFIKAFFNFKILANASPAQVLLLWSGLGYNRRALFLKRCAEVITEKYKGSLPDDERILISLPGIGTYTAAAILAFAFNKPSIVIETNIRTVFIYEFFQDREKITDKEIFPFIEQTLYKKNPRIWYWALMDYGAMIKKSYGNTNNKSRHYKTQTKFKGSNREIRGALLKSLLIQQSTLSQLEMALQKDTVRILPIIKQLIKEGFIIKNNDIYCLKK